jgi:glyoxylase-like metal-dependent hydrolase (beta-lactamase superfamily II)
MQKLTKDLYVETGFPGVTVGAVLTPEGFIGIDAPTHPADVRRWLLKLNQLVQQPFRYLINTDYHRDRVLGSQLFEAPVIAHENASERLRQLPEVFKGGLSEAGADADLAADLAGVKIIPPQITFTNRMVLCVGGHELHLVHRPGPTPGSLWVEVPAAQVVFTGDAVALAVPPPLGDADLEAWLASLAELRKARYPARTIVPGRGGLTDKDGVRAMESFLKQVRRKLDNLLRGKKTRTDAGPAAESLLAGFSVPASLREHYTRRLRAGLEQLYDREVARRG